MRVRITFGLPGAGDVGRMRRGDQARKAFFGNRRVIAHWRGCGRDSGRSDGEPRHSGEQDAA
ncbi:hypothetical protein XI07_00600 [Bradyrhizobium sp. CCBAU 11445]|nr:hypothetical protein [Bradyrhizobium sp. CCBAU 11445]